jgi:DNA-binding response OmpR family regulator
MHITLIDDEKFLSTKIKKRLEEEGFAVSTYLNYDDFMQHGDSKSHLFIVDISL